jgi:hypothetical protein
MNSVVEILLLNLCFSTFLAFIAFCPAKNQDYVRTGAKVFVYRMLKNGQHCVDMGAQYYERRNRQQQLSYSEKGSHQRNSGATGGVTQPCMAC